MSRPPLPDLQHLPRRTGADLGIVGMAVAQLLLREKTGLRSGEKRARSAAIRSVPESAKVAALPPPDDRAVTLPVGRPDWNGNGFLRVGQYARPCEVDGSLHREVFHHRALRSRSGVP